MKFMRRRRSRRAVSASVPTVVQVERLERRSLLAAAIPAIQLDQQAPDYLGEIQNQAVLFVQAENSVSLYLSDGTQSGTSLITTVNASIDRSISAQAVGSTLFFVASDSAGAELWKTDGSAAGTSRVADLNAGADDSSPADLTAFDGQLYFAATTPATGREVFRSDGTTAGTVVAIDLVSGTDGSDPSRFFVHEQKLLFSSGQSLNLYQSDGTTAGTSLMLESTMAAMSEGYPYDDVGSYVVGVVNGKLIAQRALFNQDGTTIQKQLLAYDSVADSDPDVLATARQFDRTRGGFTNYANSGERLIFQESFAIHRHTHRPPWDDLWETDGTVAGTSTIDEFVGRYTDKYELMPGEFHNNTFFATIDDMWTNNGSPQNFFYSIPGNIGTAATAGDAYFLNDDGNNVYSIRKANDANTGVEIVHTTSSPISQPVVILGELYFRVSDGNQSTLWKLDASAPVGPGPVVTSPAANAELNGYDISFEWDAVANAASYEVQVTQQIDGADVLLASQQGLTTTTATLGVDPGPSEFSVRARFADGTVTNWSELQFTNSVAPPSVTSPNGDVAENDPLIEWTVVSGAVSYDVWIAQNGQHLASGNVADASTRASVLKFNDPNPYTDNQQVRIWVRAVFESGVKTNWSAAHDFMKLPDGLLDPVRPIVRTGTDLNRPLMEWQTPEVTGATVVRTELYINKVGARSVAVYQERDLQGNSHELTERLAHGDYEAWTRVHYSDGSMTAWGNRATEFSMPVARPRDLSASYDPDTDTLTVNWGSPDDDVTFEVYVALKSDPNNPILEQSGISGRTFSTQLATSEALRVWVRAHHAQKGSSPWSFGTDATSPDTIEVLTVQVPVETADATPVLTWENAGNVARYDLYVQSPGNVVYRRQQLTTNQHEIEVPLSDGVTHKAWVRAYFNDGTFTRWGTATEFTVSDPFYNTVPSLVISNNTASWNAVDGAVQYELWVNQVDENGRTVVARAFHDRAITTTEQSLSLAAGRYRGWLRAVAADGRKTQWSEAVTFTV